MGSRVAKNPIEIPTGVQVTLNGQNISVKGSKGELSLNIHSLFELVKGITAECPSQTEIVLKGCDKQQLCQVAANIRRVRPPEPYKGKGIRYDDEHVSLKETKK